MYKYTEHEDYVSTEHTRSLQKKNLNIRVK